MMKTVNRITSACILSLIVGVTAWAQDETTPAAETAAPEAAVAETQPEASGDDAAATAETESGSETSEAVAPAEGTEGEPGAESPAAANEGEDADPAPASASATKDANELQTGEEEYDIRIRGLESKVNELKERIFRSKAKLELLTEAVTEGGLGQGAMAVIVHRNDMGSNLLLREVNYFLDGAPVWQENDQNDPDLNSKRNHVVFEGNLVEGSHTLTVQMRYQGDGSVFSYLDGYSFNLRSSHTFSTEPGKVITLESIGYEQGNFTTEFKDRPQLKFRSDLKTNEGTGR
jgi:hypothetical protein